MRTLDGRLEELALQTLPYIITHVAQRPEHWHARSFAELNGIAGDCLAYAIALVRRLHEEHCEVHAEPFTSLGIPWPLADKLVTLIHG
jgi:hypothetical protein